MLAAAAARNAKNAAESPRAVAAIYEAHATVSLHEGDKIDYRRSTVRQVSTLRGNLPPNDPAVIAVTSRLGDMWIEMLKFREAEAALNRAEKTALATGQEGPAFIAAMKRAWVLSVQGQRLKSRALLNELERRPPAQQDAYKTALAVLRLRLRLAEGDADQREIDRLVALVGQSQARAKPVLIVAPKYDFNGPASPRDAARLAALNAADGGDGPSAYFGATPASTYWADIGFWIRPDGKTAEVEILRGGKDRSWLEPAIRQIAGRRYSSPDPDATGPGFYRVERFTRRMEYTSLSDSRIVRRVATGGYDILDLTDEPAPDPPA